MYLNKHTYTRDAIRYRIVHIDAYSHYSITATFIVDKHYQSLYNTTLDSLITQKIYLIHLR